MSKTVNLTICMTPEWAESIKKEAEKRGFSLSAYIRHAHAQMTAKNPANGGV